MAGIRQLVRQVSRDVLRFRLARAVPGRITTGQADFDLRLLFPSDQETLEVFLQQSLSETERQLTRLRANGPELANRQCLFAGAFDNGSLAALLMLYIKNRREVEVGFAVSRNYRRQGLFTSGIARVDRICRDRNLIQRMRVDPRNRTILELLPQWGYRQLPPQGDLIVFHK